MIEEIQTIFAASPSRWIPVITALFLLGCDFEYKGKQVGIIVLCRRLYAMTLVCGLMLPSLIACSAFWGAVTLMHFSIVAWNYKTADNHHYLIGYWCFSVTMALLDTAATDQVLRTCGSGLIALCFLAAVYAKLMSASYRDASFFTWALLFDDRFLPIARFAGASQEMISEHRAVRNGILEFKTKEGRAQITTGVRRMALFLTWWTVLVELAVGVIFTIDHESISALRLFGITIFSITTYLLVPVSTFGMILLVMFSATAETLQPRLVALGAAALIPLVSPLSQIIAGAIKILAKGTSQNVHLK